MKKYAQIPRPCDTSEFHVVDLTKCGIPFLPVFANTHQSRPALSTTCHRHEGFIEVLFCRRGDQTTCDCEGVEYAFRPGDVFVAQPEAHHFLTSYPKSLKMYWLWIMLTNAKSQFPDLSRAESSRLLRRLRKLPPHFVGGERIRDAFRAVWLAYDRAREDDMRNVRLRLAAYNLLLDLVEVSKTPTRVNTSSALDAILAEMRTHPELNYPIGDLARRMGVNPVLLNNLFKRATGLPPHAYLTSLRIAKAKDMIRDGKLPITAIAHKLGYPTSQYFATQLRAETGLSPTAWRNN